MSAGRHAWMAAALCAQTDPDLWTDTTGGGMGPAKRICGHCPVTAQCTAHAQALEQHDGSQIRGTWGGHSQAQRHRQTAA
jgi:WhiB family redox-sensing transcriptional regulator